MYFSFVYIGIPSSAGLAAMVRAHRSFITNYLLYWLKYAHGLTMAAKPAVEGIGSPDEIGRSVKQEKRSLLYSVPNSYQR